MKKLEKILEEIKESSIVVATSEEHYIHPQDGRFVEEVVLLDCVEDIIRKHMNDGWIPVNSHGLPSSSEHDFRFWVTVQYKNGFRRTLKATWNYYNNHFVYQNGKIISEDVVAYRYYSAPKPYQPERSEGE